MDLAQLKLKYILYFMELFRLDINGTLFDVPRSMIVNMQVDKQYDTMVYPVYYVSLNIPLWVYTEIVNNQDNFSVFMNLQYKLSDNNDTLVNTESTYHTEISGNFKAVASFVTPIGDQSIQTSVEKSNDAYKRNYTFNEYMIIEIMLYNKAAWGSSFDKMGGTALSRATLTDALTYCLNKSGIKNILLSKPNNAASYNEFKILPESTIKNIMRIIEDYKFHNAGTVVFFDLLSGYIIDKNVSLTAWVPNEYKTTHIVSLTEYSSTLSMFSGLQIDNTNKYNVLAINRDSFHADKLEGSPTFDAVGETDFIRITTQQATMNMLTPNKEIILSIDAADASKYNGKYRVSSVSVNFVPKGEYLNPIFDITLRR